ncbi:MAG: hypothetical protein ABIK07_26720 [Planctomycetota bacterium]
MRLFYTKQTSLNIPTLRIAVYEFPGNSQTPSAALLSLFARKTSLSEKRPSFPVPGLPLKKQALTVTRPSPICVLCVARVGNLLP